MHPFDWKRMNFISIEPITEEEKKGKWKTGAWVEILLQGKWMTHDSLTKCKKKRYPVSEQ